MESSFSHTDDVPNLITFFDFTFNCFQFKRSTAQTNSFQDSQTHIPLAVFRSCYKEKKANTEIHAATAKAAEYKEKDPKTLNESVFGGRIRFYNDI